MYLKNFFKQALLKSRFLYKLSCHFSENVPKIFLYHRFSGPENNVPNRIKISVFKWQLSEIKKLYQIMTFGELMIYYDTHHRWPKRCAVLTVDDGYRDFFIYAYPVLRDSSLSATFFVTVNFIDQKIWLWPDRLEYILKNTKEKMLKINTNFLSITLPLNTDAHKTAARKYLNDLCIAIPNGEKHDLIEYSQKQLNVRCPDRIPEDYAASTWKEIIEMSNNGVEIGSHTMSHPVLSKISAEEVDYEICYSKKYLESKLKKQVNTFCYPNGQPDDINDYVINAVEKAGYRGAPLGSDLSNFFPYKVPRIGVSNNKEDFLVKLAGIEYFGKKYNYLFLLGKPPALPGDHNSLTDPAK